MAEAQLMKLIDLAKKHGHFVTPATGDDLSFDAAHLVAQTLNGWLAHERDTGVAIEMSEEDYLDALECSELGCASDFVNKRPQSKEAE